MRRLGLGAGISRRVGTRNGPSLDLNFLTGALDSRVTFSRASAAWAFNSAGVLTSRATDVPRFDYDPVTLAAKGLLLEEARTNLLLRSAEFDNATWARVRSDVTPNAVVAPDGTITADKLLESAAVGSAYVEQSATLTATPHTFSVYAKAAEKTFIQIYLVDSGIVAGSTVKVNLSTGAIVSGAGVVQALPNGWYRVSSTGTPLAGAGKVRIVIDEPEDGLGTSGLYLWGAQLEAGAFATSYIPTTTAAVVRAVDICHVLTSAFLFNAEAGTVFAEFTPRGVTGLQTVVYLDDTTNNERMGIRASAGTNAMLAVDGAATQVNASIGTVVAGTTYKVAMSYVLNDFAGCQNGGTVATDTVVTLPTVTRFLIGSRLSGSEVMSGHYRQARYWPTRRSNTDLQALTV